MSEDKKRDDGMRVDDSDVKKKTKKKTSGPSDFQEIKTRWTTRFWLHLRKNKY